MPAEGPPLLTPPPVTRVGRTVRPNRSREILVPFSFDQGGGVATTINPDTQVRQHVDALLRTIPGERVMKPLFGVSLLRYLFDNISPADLAAIQQAISTGIDTWVPSAQLLSLNGVTGPDSGVPSDTVIINLTYTRRSVTGTAPVTTDIPIVSI